MAINLCSLLVWSWTPARRTQRSAGMDPDRHSHNPSTTLLWILQANQSEIKFLNIRRKLPSSQANTNGKLFQFIIVARGAALAGRIYYQKLSQNSAIKTVSQQYKLGVFVVKFWIFDYCEVQLSGFKGSNSQVVRTNRCDWFPSAARLTVPYDQRTTFIFATWLWGWRWVLQHCVLPGKF